MKNIANQQHLHLLYENTSDLFILLSPEGQILEANPKLIEMHQEDIRGKSIKFLNTISSETKETLLKAIKTVHQYGDAVKIEDRRVVKGNEVVLCIRISPIRNNFGEITHLLGEAQDITQQTSYEQQLIQEQTFKDAILNNTADGIVVFDATGQIIFTNEAADEIAYFKYYSDSNLLPTDVFNFYTIDGSRHLQTNELIYTKLLNGIEVKNFEQLIKLKDDLPDTLLPLKNVFIPKSLSVSSRIIRDENQKILGTVISYKDISEQKIYENQLIEEQAFTKAILNNTAEGISVFDAAGKKTYINEIALELTGLNYFPKINSAKIANPYDFYTIDGTRKMSLEELPLGLALKGIEVKNFEEIIRLKDVIDPKLSELRENFVPRSLSVNSRIIRNETGEIKSIVISYKDITDKKNNEIALAKVNQELDNIREVERKRLARELHDGIIQDLVGFSYELANYEHLLDYQDDFYIDSDNLKTMRHQLTTSIKQLRTFVSDLRPVGLEEFGFQPALESHIALLERDKKTMHNLPKVSLNIEDTDNLSMAINLCLFRSAKEALTNILRYAKAEQVTINLFIETHIDNPTLVLMIEDNGVGFEIPNNLTNFSYGQKFGLIGIQESVALLEGEFNIKSQIDKGTTLTVTLPYEK